MGIWVKVGVVNYEITEAMEDKSGPCGYVWISNSREPLVSLTMHLNFHSPCYDLRSKKLETLLSWTSHVHIKPITACVSVHLGLAKILK